MELTVHIEKDRNTRNISFSGTCVKDLLIQLTINPETVLVVRNNIVLTEDVELNNEDSIDILSVISGG